MGAVVFEVREAAVVFEVREALAGGTHRLIANVYAGCSIDA
jgi:hypothetical protein